MVGGLRWNPIVGSSGKASSLNSTTIMVSGLSSNVRKTDLQGKFGEFGQIVRLDLDGAKAYLEFEDLRDAEDAVKALDGKTVKDSRMKVEMKHRLMPTSYRIASATTTIRYGTHHGQETPIDRQRREGLEALREVRGSAPSGSGPPRRSRSRSGGRSRGSR
eukprot:gnl/TRDRNA2_/TRDRNA2_94932_c0_seq1.p1 gnl/TRDRNA2_/TRDRNA2_94932_c0~~gnl/TRDRNA2_/TRDRNA2_94932_c0_seq1.p1  ORF type:complete len:161 (+),score=19.69 gnl/TRDRNA2_/TRDRNA2_94932_c0_seq1:47-529(+)